MKILVKVAFLSSINKENYCSLFEYQKTNDEVSKNLIIPEDIQVFFTENKISFLNLQVNSAISLLTFNIEDFQLQLVNNFFLQFDICVCLEYLLENNYHFRVSSHRNDSFIHEATIEKKELNVNYYDDRFEHVKANFKEEILSLDFSSFFNLPNNHVLITGSEDEVSNIFSFLCEKKYITIYDVEYFVPLISYLNLHNTFITLCVICKLHKYSDNDYNKLSPIVEHAFMNEHIKQHKDSKQKIVKF